jgi:hypothetical protein
VLCCGGEWPSILSILLASGVERIVEWRGAVLFGLSSCCCLKKLRLVHAAQQKLQGLLPCHPLSLMQQRQQEMQEEEEKEG